MPKEPKQDCQGAILRHYERSWNNKGKLCQWDKGPFDKLPSDFRVLEFAPNKKRSMWTYATCCLSQPEDTNPIELHIFSSVQDSSIIELLTAVTYYHRNTANLNLHHTVNFGRSWQNNSGNKYGLISLPYLDGPNLENMERPGNKLVKFYWLVPISESEVDFKVNCGVEALEEKFDEMQFNYLDPHRPSVV